MSFYFGFYNSLDHDRMYDALDMSRIFDGLILDGVYAGFGEHFIVKAAPNRYDTVIIGTGRAWFNHSWNYNDAPLFFIGDRSELIYDRIDAIVIDIIQGEQADGRINKLMWVKGEPGDKPKKPELIHDEEEEHYQYPLAFVTRRANTDYIEQADIENMVGTVLCPFVCGIPSELITADDLILQWKDQWNQFVNHYEEDLIKWFETIRGILDQDTAGKLQNEIDYLNLKTAKVVMEQTLKAGQTTLVFNHFHIGENSLLDIYVKDRWGVSPETVDSSRGTVKMVFEEQETDLPVKLIVRDMPEGVFADPER